MVGSFCDLFLWHPAQGQVLAFAEGTLYKKTIEGKRTGNQIVVGAFADTKGNGYGIDHNQGVKPLYYKGDFPSIPLQVKQACPMSWYMPEEYLVPC